MAEAVSEGTRINQSVVRLIRGDITKLEVDAFVFYAQPDLALGSGFGTAISVRGGPTIQKELDELGPLATGEAVVSAAGNLKARLIVHAVGPRFREEDTEGKLRTTVRNALQRAEEKAVRRIALPAMGAGYYGIAPDVCARVMLEVIRSHLEGETGIKEVIIWFLRFKAGGERQAPSGSTATTPARGILYSWFNVAMPWAMESTRRKFFLYAQFVIFHLGVTAAIALSFMIPYGPGLLESTAVVLFFQVLIGAAFVVGVIRIIRRVGSRYMRAISSPDDYFSLVLLTFWFLSAVLAAPNDATAGEWHLLSFFSLTAFFLVYVPFSKISHYLYYPFTRYYFGKTMGYRGVYPIQRG